jgi:hypothetical protein
VQVVALAHCEPDADALLAAVRSTAGVDACDRHASLGEWFGAQLSVESINAAALGLHSPAATLAARSASASPHAATPRAVDACISKAGVASGQHVPMGRQWSQRVTAGSTPLSAHRANSKLALAQRRQTPQRHRVSTPLRAARPAAQPAQTTCEQPLRSSAALRNNTAGGKAGGAFALDSASLEVKVGVARGTFAGLTTPGRRALQAAVRTVPKCSTWVPG